ncbi:hypothetical protein MMC21_008252 [Puttea exsequens]|nr:hypothetical protein [Puttea exsequens]
MDTSEPPTSPASSLDEWDLHEIRMDFRSAAFGQNIDRLREILNVRSKSHILRSSDLDLALMASIRHGNLPIIAFMLDNGVSLSDPGLIVPSCEDSPNLLDILKLFRQRCGWDINSTVKTGVLEWEMTMNFMIARPDADEIIAWFLANGASANRIRSVLKAPISVAAYSARNLVVPQLLLTYGATLKHTGALHAATARPSGDELALEMMALLLDHGFDINELEYEGRGPEGLSWDEKGLDQGTALHMAARKGFVDRARMLIMRGVDVGKRSEKGFTAKDWAHINGWENVREYLEAVMRAKGMVVEDIEVEEWYRGEERFSPGEMP